MPAILLQYPAPEVPKHNIGGNLERKRMIRKKLNQKTYGFPVITTILNLKILEDGLQYRIKGDVRLDFDLIQKVSPSDSGS